MKTLHLTNHFHRASGGIRIFYQALFEAARQTQHEMVLIASGEDGRTEIINDFVRVHYIASPHAPFFDRRYRVIWPSSYLDRNGGQLYGLLRDEKPDLIEIGDKYTLCWLAGLIRKGFIKGIGRPVLVGTSHERMDDNVRAFLTVGWIGRAISRLYLGQIYIPLFDHHLANSFYTAAELKRAMVDRHLRPVEVIPMGVELDHHTEEEPSAEWRQKLVTRIDGGIRTRLLLYTGRISPEKNVGLLVELMEQLQSDSTDEYHLLIAGAGPLEDWLQNESRKRAPGRVHALGHIASRTELTRILRSCDAFIHPNPREPFGIGPLEAMAAGLPLVAPTSGGILTYASTSNAWLCEPGADEFAQTVRELFANHGERARRVAKARESAAEFCWPVIARQHLWRYEEIWRSFTNQPSVDPDWSPVRDGSHQIASAETVRKGDMT